MLGSVDRASPSLLPCGRARAEMDAAGTFGAEHRLPTGMTMKCSGRLRFAAGIARRHPCEIVPLIFGPVCAHRHAAYGSANAFRFNAIAPCTEPSRTRAGPQVQLGWPRYDVTEPQSIEGRRAGDDNGDVYLHALWSGVQSGNDFFDLTSTSAGGSRAARGECLLRGLGAARFERVVSVARSDTARNRRS